MLEITTLVKAEHNGEKILFTEEAFQAYKEAKSAYVGGVAEKGKGKIDDKVYQALLNWNIEITD